MGGISDGTIQGVRAAVDIVDVVSSYVALSKAGKDYKGLCPFHEEKTPSFHVSPDRQLYYCFGCGKGGDVFRFVQERERLQFPEAVRLLAQRAGIRVDEGGNARDTGVIERLRAALDVALRYFTDSLCGPAGEVARAYLAGRGISDESVARFAIGFAPASWDGLLGYAARCGVPAQNLVEAGLARPRPQGSGCYDFFRGRIVFPIRDANGRLVGFGARSLDGEPPKYVNSQESPIFEKGKILYGLDLAKPAIRTRGAVGIVEGYTDVILAHQAGFAWVVAGLGTAFTADHARLAARHAGRAIVMLDGDEAGVRSARRVASHILAAGIVPEFALIPGGRDPADVVKEEGAPGLARILDAPEPLARFTLGRTLDEAKDPASRARAVEEFLDLLRAVLNPVTRDLLLQEAAALSRVPADGLRDRLRSPSGAAPARREAPRKRAPSGRAGSLRGPQAEICSLLLDRPDLIPAAAQEIDPTGLTDRVCRRAYDAVLRAFADGGAEAVDELKPKITGYAPDLRPEAWRSGVRDPQVAQVRLEALAAELAARRGREAIEDREREIQEAIASGPDGEVEALAELQALRADKARARPHE